MGVSVGVVMVVGVVWAASSFQGGHGLQRAATTPPREPSRWTLLSHAPTGYEGKTWEEAGPTLTTAAEEDLLQSWDYPAWLEDLILAQRRRSLAEVLAPLVYPVHKRARASAAAGGEGTGVDDGEEDADATSRRSQTLAAAGPASKRGIGLFSLAIALAQKPTSPPEPKMHPADLSAYPRRARFFVATMG